MKDQIVKIVGVGDMISMPHAYCAICSHVYIKPSVLPCGHTFCKDCLSKWLVERRICPHCRGKVPTRFTPIGLSGWDDTLESLALQLPVDEQVERSVLKRQREEAEELVPPKRIRTNRSEQIEGVIENLTANFSETLDGLDDEFNDGEESQVDAEEEEEEWEEDFLSVVGSDVDQDEGLGIEGLEEQVVGYADDDEVLDSDDDGYVEVNPSLPLQHTNGFSLRMSSSSISLNVNNQQGFDSRFYTSSNTQTNTDLEDTTYDLEDVEDEDFF